MPPDNSTYFPALVYGVTCTQPELMPRHLCTMVCDGIERLLTYMDRAGGKSLPSGVTLLAG